MKCEKCKHWNEGEGSDECIRRKCFEKKTGKYGVFKNHSNEILFSYLPRNTREGIKNLLYGVYDGNQ